MKEKVLTTSRQAALIERYIINSYDCILFMSCNHLTLKDNLHRENKIEQKHKAKNITVTVS